MRLSPKKPTLLLLLSGLLASGALAQQPVSTPPLITTTGTAEVRVAPDLADLTFIVEVRGPNLEEVRRQQAERVTKVLAALQTGGVAQKELQTTQAQISANYGSENQGAADKLQYFEVSQTIVGTLHDVAKVPDVTAAALAAGATGMRGVGLRNSEHRKHRDLARTQAVKAAREKAIAMAAALGARVGKPYSITEGSGYETFQMNTNFVTSANAAGLADVGEGGSFAPGTVGLSARVTVSFWLE